MKITFKADNCLKQNTQSDTDLEFVTLFEDVKGKTCCQKTGHDMENSKCGKMRVLNFCERQMSSSALSSMSPALPVEPLKRWLDRPEAGHTGTNQLTITVPNLSFPGFK